MDLNHNNIKYARKESMDGRRRQNSKVFDLSKRLSEMVSNFEGHVGLVQNLRAKWEAM